MRITTKKFKKLSVPSDMGRKNGLFLQASSRVLDYAHTKKLPIIEVLVLILLLVGVWGIRFSSSEEELSSSTFGVLPRDKFTHLEFYLRKHDLLRGTVSSWRAPRAPGRENAFLFIVDEVNFERLKSGLSFQSLGPTESSHYFTFQVVIPNSDTWYFVFRNPYSDSNIILKWSIQLIRVDHEQLLIGTALSVASTGLIIFACISWVPKESREWRGLRELIIPRKATVALFFLLISMFCSTILFGFRTEATYWAWATKENVFDLLVVSEIPMWYNFPLGQITEATEWTQPFPSLFPMRSFQRHEGSITVSYSFSLTVIPLILFLLSSAHYTIITLIRSHRILYYPTVSYAGNLLGMSVLQVPFVQLPLIACPMGGGCAYLASELWPRGRKYREAISVLASIPFYLPALKIIDMFEIGSVRQLGSIRLLSTQTVLQIGVLSSLIGLVVVMLLRYVVIKLKSVLHPTRATADQ